MTSKPSLRLPSPYDEDSSMAGYLRRHVTLYMPLAVTCAKGNVNDDDNWQLTAVEGVRKGAVLFTEAAAAKIVKPANEYDEKEPIMANVDVLESIKSSKTLDLLLQFLCPRGAGAASHPVFERRHQEIQAVVPRVVAACGVTHDAAVRLLALSMLNSLAPDHDCGREDHVFGLWMLTSLMNHSCRPNCVHYLDPNVSDLTKSRLIVRAIEDIQPNEPLSIAYIELAQTQGNRQTELLDKYFFHCSCERCALLDDEMNGDHQEIMSHLYKARDIAEEHGNMIPLGAMLSRIDAEYPVLRKLPELFFVRYSMIQGLLNRNGLGTTHSELLDKVSKDLRETSTLFYPSCWPTVITCIKYRHACCKRIGHSAEEIEELRQVYTNAQNVCRGKKCSNCRKFQLQDACNSC